MDRHCAHENTSPNFLNWPSSIRKYVRFVYVNEWIPNGCSSWRYHDTLLLASIVKKNNQTIPPVNLKHLNSHSCQLVYFNSRSNKKHKFQQRSMQYVVAHTVSMTIDLSKHVLCVNESICICHYHRNTNSIQISGVKCQLNNKPNTYNVYNTW